MENNYDQFSSLWQNETIILHLKVKLATQEKGPMRTEKAQISLRIRAVW